MVALALGTGVDADAYRRPGRPPAPVKRPAPIDPPRLVGSGRIGTVVRAEPGAWSGAPGFAYRWRLDGANIPGATGPTYRPVPADDRGRLAVRVTATNAAGQASAVAGDLAVAWPAPLAAGRLPDVSYFQHPGFETVNASTDFTGGALSFSVAGEGVSVDPATGVLRIPTDTLSAGLEVVVTAENSGGAATSRFRVTVAAVPEEPTAPVKTAAPELVGTGRIGEVIELDPGTWAGVPAPVLALQWLRDGEAIPGATGPAYTPGPEDDLREIAARVTASNAAGEAAAETAPLAIAWPAPSVVAELFDIEFVQGPGFATAEAGAAFAGGALVFAVTGAGASIDPATGRLSIPTELPLADAQVTVTASNSGGSAATGFRVTVEPALRAPVLVAAPGLAGAGKVGAEVVLDAGVWDGEPAPEIAVQWRRDGVDIPGATGAAYVPGPADDLTALTARVTASNAAGAASAETAPMAITRAAPVVVAPLADRAFAQGSGPQEVEAGAAFAGEGLVFAVNGAGATVDPATGRVSIPTADRVAGAEVTVTAANSGGAAATGFRVTVAAPVAPPVAVGTLADMVYEQGSGGQTVSAQAGFAGTDLAFALDAAPAGVTINPGSGLVTIPTDALVAAATVTVRASNSGGAATSSFRVTVRSTRTVFDAAAALAELSFLHQATPPAWTLDAAGFARLVPAAADRAHGVWSKAAGDGRYRCLARWSGSTAGSSSPFVFGARVRQAGANFTGFYVNAFQPSSGTRMIRLHQFTGSGTATDILAAVSPGWEWGSWYWFEVEIEGTAVRARIYPEAATAPAWQLAGTTGVTADGAFGPGAFGGARPSIDLRRLEYQPLVTPVAPAAAQGGDWTLGQIGVQ